MLTSPITTPHFHSRVLAILSTTLSQQSNTSDVDVTRTYNASPIIVPELTPADTPLTPDDTIPQIIGITSPWIDVSSPDPIIADVSRQVLKLELAYAAFCGITHAVIQAPRLRGNGASDSRVAHFARALTDALANGPYMQLYLWFPMIDNEGDQYDSMGDLAPFARQRFLQEEDSEQDARMDLFGTWEAWDMIRSICNYPSRLCVGKHQHLSHHAILLVSMYLTSKKALSLPKVMPPTPVQTRWYSEPVRLLTLDSKIFAKNAKGYPVLTRAHQSFINRMVRLRSVPWFLLCNVSQIPPLSYDSSGNVISTSTGFPSLAEAATNPHLKDPAPHLSYMRNLQTKQTPLSDLDRFGSGYQDYLQAPLQPLTVNLESITYEVFEKDPVKYAWYERAVARALHDWIEQGKPTSNPDGRVVVAVVGAGRGPLVTRALKASRDVDVDIDMWALEKNPNAFVLLQRHNQTTWNQQVNLVKSDMRTWRGPLRPANMPTPRRIYNTEDIEAEDEDEVFTTAADSPKRPSATEAHDVTEPAQPIPYKIDILISELLGSFADNELSPECLDGVQHLMNPVHGISIPSSYTAHITPIAAPKLHADINHGLTSTTPHAAEIPYVVMFNAIDFLSTTTTSSSSSSTSTLPSSTSPVAVASPPVSVPNSQPLSPTSGGPPYSKIHTMSSSSPSLSPSPSPSPSSPPISVPPPPQPSTPTPIIGTTWSFQHPNPYLPNPIPFTTTNPSSSSPSSSLSNNTQIYTEPTRNNSHNARSSILRFPIRHRGTCHGLAGYFETVLYKGVELSTNPNTMDAKSEGMISWFPIYFPLKVCMIPI